MKRSDGDSPISLFSFQDIITSITGIMFLVILLLMLMMLQVSKTAIQRRDPSEAARLKKELQILRQELDKINTQDLDLASELQKLNKYPPEELSRMLAELRQQIAALQTAEIAELQDHELQKLRLKKLQQQIAEQRRKNTRLTGQQQDLISAIKTLQAQIRREEKIISQRKKVIKYTVSHNTMQEPVLIELDKNGAQLLRLSNNERNDFRVTDNGSASLIKLQSFLAGQSPVKYYYSVVAKPGGFRYASNLIAWLKVNGFKRGIEILPNDDSTVIDTGDAL